MYRLICQKPAHSLSAKIVLVITFFQMFIVLGNFAFDTFVPGIWIGFKLIWTTEKIFGHLLYILEMLSTSRNLDLLERNLWSICGIGPAHIWCTIPRFSKPMYNVEWVLKTFLLIHICVLLVRKICFQKTRDHSYITSAYFWPFWSRPYPSTLIANVIIS